MKCIQKIIMGKGVKRCLSVYVSKKRLKIINVEQNILAQSFQSLSPVFMKIIAIQKPKMFRKNDLNI